MNASRLAKVLMEIFESFDDCGAGALGEPQLDGAKVGTFADAGVITNNDGVVVTLANGSEFHVTVVQSKGAR